MQYKDLISELLAIASYVYIVNEAMVVCKKMYRKSGNFHVEIIHVNLFSWVYGTHENILTWTYFNTNI